MLFHPQSTQRALNLFYQIPGKINGYTFVDLYKNGQGYFGKTTLDKEIKYGIGPKAQIVHGNEPYTMEGFGINGVVPMPSKNTFAKVGFTPVWYSPQGRLSNRSIANYYIKSTLPKGFEISSFGEWNLTAKDGAKWAYGEIEIGKKIGKVKLSYNPALISDGDATPNLENRVAVTADL